MATSGGSTSFTFESQFGPPSELILISEFIVNATESLQNRIFLPPAETDEDLSVSDIRITLSQTWNEPSISAYLTKTHNNALMELQSKAKVKSSKKSTAAPIHLSNEAKVLKQYLDNSPLKVLKFAPEVHLFSRNPRNSDYNALGEIKPSPKGADASPAQALITCTIYSKIAWGPTFVSRTSSHVVLSSQTLQDLYDVIPCTSKSIPAESLEDGRFVGYTDIIESDRSLICVEDQVYGSDDDIANRFIELARTVSKKNTELNKAPTTMSNTTFSSLSIRVNEPYWILHKGNCEHFVVVDQVRMCHSSDPCSGYPLTVQVTPTLLDLCRACSRVPATWSVVGDIRLGESPCLLCDPCWKTMGPSGDAAVIAVPIVLR